MFTCAGKVTAFGMVGCVVLVLGLAAPAGAQAIIIDHACTDLSQVPAYWIDQAKLLTIHYGHTSHGSQVNSGAERLESLDAFYSFARRESGSEGLPPIEDPPALRMYDGNPPETYISPDDYWASESGRDRTRAVVDTGHYNYSMWSWCGEASWADQSYMQSYLNTMTQFESEYPNMRFILMTGHTDGSGEDGTLNIRNNQIRAYAAAYNMVLFDFADIESHDPDGGYYLDLGCDDYGHYDGGGDWPAEWCAAHPGSALCASCSCAHSQSLICNLKGRAFWWMMARLAGWPGPSVCAGDLNCDGTIDYNDIDPFVGALSCVGGVGWTSPCPWLSADCDGDGEVSYDDIDAFVALIGTDCQ